MRKTIAKKIINALFLIISLKLTAQTKDEKIIKKIYETALTQSKCYSWLDDLSNKIGQRLTGSENAEKAVVYTKKELESLKLDNVYLQDVMVSKWVRGKQETAYILNKNTQIPVAVCALGHSVPTPEKGITAEIIEVKSLNELSKLKDKIKGKIVFYNRPMNPLDIETFTAYGNCVDQRSSGAKEAAKYGAIASIVRSMNLRLDNLPHTGIQDYGDLPKSKHIPAAAISTNDAELLSKLLKENTKLKFHLEQSCQILPEVLSHNVIGEIKGTDFPENIMLVGGHLDSWDLGDGSHDDGAGVVQSMEVLNVFKTMNYKPRNTLRVVLFMDEEQGGRGADKYQELTQKNNENHIFALESDLGGFSPRGFAFEADDSNLKKIESWRPLFEPYQIHSFVKGHSGTDLEPFTSKSLIKAGLRPDSQRYFDYHHASNDKFDSVNKRELELGAAAMASLIYLIDQK